MLKAALDYIMSNPPFVANIGRVSDMENFVLILNRMKIYDKLDKAVVDVQPDGNVSFIDNFKEVRVRN